MGNYCKQYRDKIDERLFSMEGGRFSPSKINIFIGQVLFVIWSICLFGHSIILFNKFINWLFEYELFSDLYDYRYLFYILFIAVLFFTLYYSYDCLEKRVKSSVIKEI